MSILLLLLLLLMYFKKKSGIDKLDGMVDDTLAIDAYLKNFFF